MADSAMTHLLPALNDALSGAAGTAISTAATYPLELVVTRLKVQRKATARQGHDHRRGRRQTQINRNVDGGAKSDTGNGLGNQHDEHDAFSSCSSLSDSGVLDAFRSIAARQVTPSNSSSTGTPYRPYGLSKDNSSISHFVEKISGALDVLGAFYAGLGADVGKHVADSFLFFLFYNVLQSRLSSGHGSSRSSSSSSSNSSSSSSSAGKPPSSSSEGECGAAREAVRQLLSGALAGAASRLITTPVDVVVTRRKAAAASSTSTTTTSAATAKLPSSFSPTTQNGGESQTSLLQVLKQIRKENGLQGLWAGYEATLVLTLNPAITFFLQERLTSRALGRNNAGRKGSENGPGPGAVKTFLIAALSKCVATAATYPFQVAKARTQVAGSDAHVQVVDTEERKPSAAARTMTGNTSHHGSTGSRLARLTQLSDTVFGLIVYLAKTEGLAALYAGLGAELLKHFFSHGITMASKDVVHSLVIRLYFLASAWLGRRRGTRSVIR